MGMHGQDFTHAPAGRLLAAGVAVGMLGILFGALQAHAAAPESDPAAMTSTVQPGTARQATTPLDPAPVNAWYAAAPADGMQRWPGAAGEPATGAGQPTVASVFAQHAVRELEADEMRKMRGGFLLFSSVAMDIRIEFAARVNGDFVPVMVDPSIFGASGIYTRLADGVATVQGTNQFSGLVTAVQNNLSFQDLQTATYATFNLTGSMASLRGSLFRSELNYTMSSLRH
jgi:hypothetical protein